MSQGTTEGSAFVLIEITAPEGMEDATREQFVHAIRTSHKPGFVGAQIFESETEVRTFLSLQEWESEAAFRQHMTDNEKGLADNRELLESAPRLRILRTL